jgi:Transposase DDE domain
MAVPQAANRPQRRPKGQDQPVKPVPSPLRKRGLIIVRRAAGTTGFVVQPRRWVVERSLGWFGRCRRLSKDYEALPEVSEAMVTLAAIRLMLHRLAHPNRRRLPAP